MSDSYLIEALNERIKELTCLYEISNIAVDTNLSLDDQLQSIVQILPKAWKYPEHGVAELNLDSKFFFSDKLPLKHVSQKNVIVVDERERGYLAMHYDASFNENPVFLPEEHTLLKTLAQEVGGIIFRNEQKQREALLQRKFQHSDRLTILGELTAGIAHELNTPLGNILGFAQLIQEHSQDQQVSRDTEKIIDSALHAREIVKKLMFFSCEMPQQMKKVAINKLIEDALDLLKFTIKNARVKVVFSPKCKELIAQVDPVQFTQVVFNLIINAIHASSAGQQIDVALESEITSFSLTVRDQGHGIKKSIKDKIFEPFFTTKITGEGSGLGLSVVHGIIKSHGGALTVKSKENAGATFEVVLPLTQYHE
ncbi:MAG: hypothetical protein DHS20C09_14490 [marine bacterium B5-7]|nr:MAG: hypothetical protein DHS20C09_14490 [marine bacterium B5-7]